MYIIIMKQLYYQLSQPIKASDRRIGRMFPEQVERSFLDPEYSFDEYFQLGSRTNIRPIKNGLKAGKRKDLGSILLRLSFLFKNVVVCGHCLVTLTITSY